MNGQNPTAFRRPWGRPASDFGYASLVPVALLLLVLLLLSPGCSRRTSGGSAETDVARESGSVVTRDATTAASAIDAPEISRSVGEPEGIVLFWPRVIPSAQRDGSRELAASLQERMRALLVESFPGRAIDVRPEPERVCPQPGCEAATVGILLLREEQGCAIAALVSPPGRSPATLVPIAGQMEVEMASVPFREPPESSVNVKDFARCDEVLATFEQNAVALRTRLKAVIGD